MVFLKIDHFSVCLSKVVLNTALHDTSYVLDQFKRQLSITKSPVILLIFVLLKVAFFHIRWAGPSKSYSIIRFYVLSGKETHFIME